MQVPLILITEPVFTPVKAVIPAASNVTGVTVPPVVTARPEVVDVNSVSSAEPLNNCTLHATVPERTSPTLKP